MIYVLVLVLSDFLFASMSAVFVM